MKALVVVGRLKLGHVRRVINRKPHILFHRSTPWHSAIECSTKTYAKRFRDAGYQVTYLQDLANPGHIISRKGYYDTWSRGCRWDEDIWVATACSWLPRLRGSGKWMDISLALSYRLASPSVREVVRGAGRGDPAVIWTTAPGSSVLKRLFPGSKVIFHVVDYYPAFRGEAIKRVERSDYLAADHVFSIGRGLSDYLETELGVSKDKITTLGQGAPLEHYAKTYPTPSEIRILPRPRAIYVGVLAKIDVGLLDSLAKAVGKESGSVVLIGPGASWVDSFVEAHSCVRWIGPKTADRVPAYLAHADIGLMLYDRGKEAVYRGQNPLKLYEYAAAGLPVLSTPHEEYRYINPPARIVKDEEEVRRAVIELMRSSTAAEISSMKKFAESHSWQSCGERAQGAVDLLLSRG